MAENESGAPRLRKNKPTTENWTSQHPFLEQACCEIHTVQMDVQKHASVLSVDATGPFTIRNA